MIQQQLNLPEVFPEMPKVLAAIAKYGEQEITSTNLEIRLQEDLDPALLCLLKDHSYIQVKHAPTCDLYSLTEKGKAFLQNYLSN
jgi:predicted transcriptional regulator